MTHDEILDRYENELEDYDSAIRALADRDRYVLIQRNTRNGRYWLTAHETPKDAACYIAQDEYPEDWETIELHDTATGRSLQEAPREFAATLAATRSQAERERDDALAVCRAVLLFYGAPFWGPTERGEWEQITGTGEATTRVLANAARRVLGITVEAVGEEWRCVWCNWQSNAAAAVLSHQAAGCPNTPSKVCADRGERWHDG